MNSSKSNWSNYLYLKDQKMIIAIVGLTLAASSYLGYITPLLISDLYQSYESSNSTMTAIWALAYLFVAEYCVQMVYQVCLNRYVQKLVEHIRNISFKKWILAIESGGRGHYGDNKYPMGEVLARVLTDTEAVIEMVSTGSFKIVIDITFIVSCLIGFIKLNTVSGIALIICEVLVCAALVYGSKKMAKVYMEVRVSTGIMSRVIANLSGGFRFTYFHPNKNYASKIGHDSFEDFLKKQLKANIWDASYFSIAESLFPILLVLLVLIFPYSNISEMAVLAAIIDLIQRSIGPIKEITGKVSSIQRARTGIIRVEEFNSDLSRMPAADWSKKFEVVELKELNVRINEFSYPQKEDTKLFKLSNIEFSAKPGELVGIVGQSGCGKSTLLKILATDIIAEKSKVIIDCQTGRKINYPGEDINSFLEYKNQVNIVSQDSHLFSASLKFNITMSDSEIIGFDKFWVEVCKKIKYLDNWGIGLADIIKPKELSLGQKQLISALRSCFLSRPIVLFDEISSGLDSELEEALRELVLIIQKKSLTIIVAHRIETIVNANQILVMEEGRVAARGEHSDLLNTSAVYQEFITQLNKAH